MRVLAFHLLAILAVSSLIPAQAHAQVALEPVLGWSQGVHGGLDRRPDANGARVGPVFGVGWRAGSWREEARYRRFGINLTTQQVKIFGVGSLRETLRYRLTCLQASFERAPWRGRLGALVTDLGLGFAWLPRPGSNPGGDWDTSSVLPRFVALSLEGRAVMPIYGPISLTLGARGNLLSHRAAATYPFKSGVMLLAGVEYFVPAGPPINP